MLRLPKRDLVFELLDRIETQALQESASNALDTLRMQHLPTQDQFILWLHENSNPLWSGQRFEPSTTLRSLISAIKDSSVCLARELRTQLANYAQALRAAYGWRPTMPLDLDTITWGELRANHLLEGLVGMNSTRNTTTYSARQTACEIGKGEGITVAQLLLPYPLLTITAESLQDGRRVGHIRDAYPPDAQFRVRLRQWVLDIKGSWTGLNDTMEVHATVRAQIQDIDAELRKRQTALLAAAQAINRVKQACVDEVRNTASDHDYARTLTINGMKRLIDEDRLRQVCESDSCARELRLFKAGMDERRHEIEHARASVMPGEGRSIPRRCLQVIHKLQQPLQDILHILGADAKMLATVATPDVDEQDVVDMRAALDACVTDVLDLQLADLVEPALKQGAAVYEYIIGDVKKRLRLVMEQGSCAGVIPVCSGTNRTFMNWAQGCESILQQLLNEQEHKLAEITQQQRAMTKEYKQQVAEFSTRCTNAAAMWAKVFPRHGYSNTFIPDRDLLRFLHDSWNASLPVPVKLQALMQRKKTRSGPTTPLRTLLHLTVKPYRSKSVARCESPASVAVVADR